jgi:uncharacterized protein YecE (DUF72 family)
MMAKAAAKPTTAEGVDESKPVRVKAPTREFKPFAIPKVPIFVGTSGWAYSIWKPEFYPQDVAAKNFLKFYGTALNAVEVNYTFRRMLSAKAAESWMADTGPGFRFAIKMHQSVTHFKRLKNVEESLKYFLTNLEPLHKKGQLGPILVQLPPNLKADAGLLREFLAQLPRVVKFAFEFRHNSWFTEEIYNVMRDRNAALCVAETEDFTTPDVRTASFIYFRFRRPSYNEAEITQLARRVRRCLGDGVETFAFFKHEEDPRSPLNAVKLLESVASSGSEEKVSG